MIYQFPLIDKTPELVMVIWKIGGKIIRIVLRCIVYPSCAQWYADASSSSDDTSLGLGLISVICSFLTKVSLCQGYCVVYFVLFVSSLGCCQFGCQYQRNKLPGETRLRNHLLYIKLEVKPYLQPG